MSALTTRAQKTELKHSRQIVSCLPITCLKNEKEGNEDEEKRNNPNKEPDDDNDDNDDVK